jgi:hypothetical protein
VQRIYGDPAPGLIGREYLERWVFRRNGADLVIARVWADALEEDPDLCLPPLQVGAQHRYLLVVGELPAAEALGASAHAQFASADSAQVAHPLVSPRGATR